MATGLRDVDHGYRQRLKSIAGLPGTVSVGIHAAEGAQAEPKGDVTVLQVAIWNHFGVVDAEGKVRIPARPFLTDWFDANQERATKMWTALNRQVAAGKITSEQALNLFGQKCVGEIQRKIADGVPPPNADSTIARKGSSKPLIDTGQLRSSITYRATLKH